MLLTLRKSGLSSSAFSQSNDFPPLRMFLSHLCKSTTLIPIKVVTRRNHGFFVGQQSSSPSMPCLLSSDGYQLVPIRLVCKVILIETRHIQCCTLPVLVVIVYQRAQFKIEVSNRWAWNLLESYITKVISEMGSVRNLMLHRCTTR